MRKQGGFEQISGRLALFCKFIWIAKFLQGDCYANANRLGAITVDGWMGYEQ